MPLDLVVALNEHHPTALGLCGNIMNTVIPALLQARAGKLGCVIIANAGHEKGPFLLWWEGYSVWGHGLPAEGVADALDRIERERRLWLAVKTGEWCDDTAGSSIRHDRGWRSHDRTAQPWQRGRSGFMGTNGVDQGWGVLRPSSARWPVQNHL
jgi:hypothetical protein